MAKRRRRWEELLEREPERPVKPRLAELDADKRASVLEELQSAGGNRALQHVVEGAQLQREAAPKLAPGPVDVGTYMAVDGIKGPVTRKGHEGQFEVKEFTYELTSPTDPATGMPTGKRRHHPVVVTIPKSGSLPQFMGAVARNQTIKQIIISEPAGEDTMTTTLTDASIRGVKMLPGGLVQLTIVFREIEMTSSSGITESDVWYGPL